MNVKLELSFESLEELREFLDARTGCKCQAAPMPAQQPVAISEPVAIMPPPQAAPAPLPAEPAPLPTPPAPTAEAVPSPGVSTAAHTYKLDDIARAGASLVGLGKQAELGVLLQRFGIASLPELPVDKYGEMALALREMGARI